MIRDNSQNKATRITASSFGALAGLAGIIAGYYETLRGYVAPESLWISFIGPEYSMWENGAYNALTIIPSYYITGILAITVSILVLIWSTGFIQRKNGAKVMLLLAVTQFLVGGGVVLDLGIVTCIMATRINKPLDWWKKHIPERGRVFLAWIWPLSVVAFALLSFMLLGATILGVNNSSIVNLVLDVATLMIIPTPLMIFGGFAYDAQMKANKLRAHPTKNIDQIPES